MTTKLSMNFTHQPSGEHRTLRELASLTSHGKKNKEKP